MPVITKDMFSGTAGPRDRLVRSCLFARFMFVHDIQRINFHAYFTNRIPPVYFIDVAQHSEKAGKTQ